MEDDNSKSSSTAGAGSTIVTFNVGGTRYQVSRSLLDQFPNSMLSKSASEQWQEDPASDIFIERNGVRFQYVLDYMRDDKVDVPLSQTKASILAELEYFGIDVADKTVIDCSKTIATRGIGYAHLVVSQLQEFKRELDEDIAVKKLASFVLKSILEMGFDSLKAQQWSFNIKSSDNYDLYTACQNQKTIDDADAILNKVGLKIKEISWVPLHLTLTPIPLTE